MTNVGCVSKRFEKSNAFLKDLMSDQENALETIMKDTKTGDDKIQFEMRCMRRDFQKAQEML